MVEEAAGEDAELSTELFQVLAYQTGLRLEDLQLLTIGMVLDYIQEYISQNKPKKNEVKKRKATQADFDAF